jgi:hypothetical protein
MELEVLRPAAARAVREPADGLDLLRLAPVRALIRWRGFPYVFQGLALAGFVALMMMAWGQFIPAEVPSRTFARTNLVTLLVWGLWWPAMVWVAVLLGRAWCGICPLELVSNIAERLGRGLGLRQRRLPGWIAGGSIILILYLLTQMMVAGAQLHRTPAWTAVFLLVLLALAAVTGLLLRDRAFCRGFCPVGMLLAVYGRWGMLAVRPRSSARCDGCAGRECIHHARRTRGDARSCPSLLNVPQLDSSEDCLLCTQCIKSCDPAHANMALLLRRPLHPADARPALATWPITLFIMLLSGFVVYELCTEWKSAQDVFLAAPRWASAMIGVAWLGGYVNGLWSMVVVPLVLWSGAALLARMLGERAGIGDIWRRMALPVAVVAAAGHMAKGLAKFVSWAQFLPGAIGDPSGADTAAAIAGKSMLAPAPIMGFGIVAALSLALMLVACIYAIREARLAQDDGPMRASRLAPMLALSMFLVLLVVGWNLQ